ncbi:MAG: hypothetical protein KF684_05110 [Phycisphaeraceae bacterium]|nr:hypothetical protein [Phycisphaeraceae bacterium]
MMKHTVLVVSLLGSLGLAAGCERSSPSESGVPSAPVASAPAGLFASLPTDGAKSVVEAKSAAREGETVLVRGRIGGSVSPFVEGRAMFTIVDAAMPACSDTPGDGCKTPWDYCCDDPADIARHAATIAVNGPDGGVLRASLKGQGGLRELATVVVRGTVAQSDGSVLVIHADTISVVEPGQ